jgi:AraC family transcriptional regulator of adaptative response / DNA-3-methyladenine glycosylase II
MDLPIELDHDACYRAIATRDARFDGRFFTAVKTTRIYCRPICPARTPKPENVVFFPSAAAAQSAGFRPCLRCRPETAPELAAWRGTSNTIARALALIEGGALDDNDVDALATRLGVGERHLRRLFDQHLGASPIAVAQTRRVLLAKQLIHETTLPMTQIAMAAGFGSIRRFNETFSRLFGRPPSKLRRIAATDDSRAASGTTILLRYKPPYDWPAMLAFLQFRAISGLESVSGDSYSRSINVGGMQGIVTVESSDRQALRATISMPKLTALPTIIARIRRVFDLAADPQSIGAHLSEDPVMAKLVRARPGLRVPGAWDGFELAVRAVLGQQITVRAAIQLASRLVARYGDPLTIQSERHPGITHVFPRPEVMAAADLSTLGMPKARAKSLSSLAAAVAADPQIFSAKRSLEETIAQLRNLAGVGEWTAQYIAMRELREPDAFPAADIGLMRAMVDATGQRPDPRELLQRAEQWRPWRAYAAQQLWAADAATIETKTARPSRGEAGVMAGVSLR